MDTQTREVIGRSIVKFKCDPLGLDQYQTGLLPSSMTKQDVSLLSTWTTLRWQDPKIKFPKCYSFCQPRSRWTTLVDRFLGCHHRELDPISVDGHLVRRVEYDMRDFLDSAVKMYYELAGPNAKPLKKVATPYIPDNELCPDGIGAPQTVKPQDKKIPVSTPEDQHTAVKPGGPKPHEGKQKNNSIKTQQWSKGTKLTKWTRTDKMAKAYRTTNKNGPSWHQVVSE
eukprot:1997158-Amphidinium_carterae.1